MDTTIVRNYPKKPYRRDIEEKLKEKLEVSAKRILLAVGNAEVLNRELDGDCSEVPVEYVTIRLQLKDMNAAKLIGEFF